MTASPIPRQHAGMHYIEFMKLLSQKRCVKKYLEIGVEMGHLLREIHADEAYGIDPSFNLSANVCVNKRSVQLYQCTSDAAFADDDKVSRLRGVDLAFLDGYHTFEYLLRDFANVEKLSHKRTLIALHDALPLNEIMTIRNQSAWSVRTRGTAYEGYWTGDVWKTVAILRKYRPDLRIVCTNCPPTGIVFITNLDPGNAYIERKYLDIVAEFSALGNDMERLQAFYDEIDIVDSSAIANENDHSLYFMT